VLRPNDNKGLKGGELMRFKNSVKSVFRKRIII